MTFTMLRLGMIAALAAAGAGAKAGPDPSPFAGTYVWGTGGVSVTISEDGQISSSNYDIKGRVHADGAYSFTVTLRGPIDPDDRRRGRKWWRSVEKFAGTMVLSADGNVVGTAVDGESFVWVRQ